MTDPLAQAIMGQPDVGRRSPQLRYGTVTQVSPLLVKVGAASIGQPCNRVASYQPVLNDYVSVIVQGADRVVVDSLLSNAWPTYDPALTAPSTNPNLGSTGSKSGAFRRDGRRITWRAQFAVGGSGISAGSGQWSVAVPATPLTDPAIPATQILGSGYLYNGGIVPFHVDWVSGATRLLTYAASPTAITGSNGMSSAGHYMTMNGSFEAAT